MNWSNGALSNVTIKSNSGNVCNVRYGNKTISFPTTAGGTYQLNGSLQLVGSTTTLTNVALNKTVTASGNTAGEEPENAVDGSNSTKWCHVNGISGEWLKVDLGVNYDISRWVVKHAGVAEAIKFNTRDFTLQKSDDGNVWTDVDAVHGNQQNISDRNIPTFTARYVRLNINTATQDNSGGARVYEFELWGKSTDGSTPVPTSIQTMIPTPTQTPTPTLTPSTTPVTRSAFTQNEAESFDKQSGVQTEACTEGGEDVGYIENGDYVVYNNVNFGSGAASFQVRCASASGGGNIEIRLDSITGPLVGTCQVASNGEWQTYDDAKCSVNGASGIHNLYLVFKGDSGYLFNLNWWKFIAVPSTPTATQPLIPTPANSSDINHDGVINMADVILLASRFNTVIGNAGYVDAYDLNKDGAINMTDVILIAAKFNTIV
ncbi:Carbohydrate binding family 6 [Pseudobacteroides cellulosolvens ATCC 35603 = DSM 2933]|uniref:Carbohydrate binding family 6 n=2 Tax=Pseudobacteroides cellulosolvens TaxID=35825 RepID=A0A0L6JQ80_9FIRM|nr:Carbohydrate binding family 6 [Pseudobacteroides cellulosolvens ATCC 35603 = DSM 2933]